MADDDDTNPIPADTQPPDAIVAVYQWLAAVATECEQLATAMLNNDAEDAEIAAGDAFKSLLAARAALQRIDVRNRDAIALARKALLDSHRSIIQQFRRTAATINVPALHQRLRRLRLSLALTSGEPPTNN